MAQQSTAEWVAWHDARAARRAEADVGQVGTDRPRDPAGDWPGEDHLTPEQAAGHLLTRLASWS